MKRTAVIFDLDGTLIDSAPDLQAALAQVLGEAGRPALDVGQVRRLIGDGSRALVERGFAQVGPALDEPALDRALARFIALYTAAPAAATRPYPGVGPVLQRLPAPRPAPGPCTHKTAPATPDELRGAV